VSSSFLFAVLCPLLLVLNFICFTSHNGELTVAFMNEFVWQSELCY